MLNAAANARSFFCRRFLPASAAAAAAPGAGISIQLAAWASLACPNLVCLLMGIPTVLGWTPPWLWIVARRPLSVEERAGLVDAWLFEPGLHLPTKPRRPDPPCWIEQCRCTLGCGTPKCSHGRCRSHQPRQAGDGVFAQQVFCLCFAPQAPCLPRVTNWLPSVRA